MARITGMKRESRFKKWLRFDEPDDSFELLETEGGAPGFFHGRRARPKPKEQENRSVSTDLEENKNRLKREFRGDINTDLILRSFVFASGERALAAFINGMADEDQINDFILRRAFASALPRENGQKARYALEHIFAMQEAELSDKWADVKRAVLEGRTAVFMEGQEEAVLMDTRGFACRGVSEPKNEHVVIGPHEAFNENIRISVTLLRRILKMPEFVCEFREAGGKNNVRLAICYLDGTANNALVEEVKKRLAKIETDTIISAGTIEQFIEDHPGSPVPQILLTERPDRTAAAIMQGKVALLIEGSSQAAVMPVNLSMLLISAEDAYMRRSIGTVVRIVRMVGAFISVLMPAWFLALATHHQGLLSSEVLYTVVSSRKLVFMPLQVEMIFLLLVFQLVREAGIRVPGAVGQTVGIIGGLILGQAAVSANIVSTVVLIIVALTGLGNFVIPDYSLQLSIAYYRVLLCIMATLGGLLGVFTALLVSIAFLASQKSFGVPFLSPFAPKAVQREPLLIRGKVRMQRKPQDDMNPERSA